MKRSCWIVLLFLLALSACDTTTREARRMVKRADRLADTLPDSAVRLIDSVLRMPASFSERERMDMALLQAEALFGDHGQEISPIMDDDFFDDHANLSTSPELERAAAYYARKKQYGKAAHAALYSGFVQQHYDEKEAAMRSFKGAEEYGKMVDDSLTVAMAEYWMGKNLIDDGMEQEAMNLLMSSEGYFGNRYVALATIENSMAVVNILLRQYDSAQFCLQRSLLYAKIGNSDKVKRRICNNFSVLYRSQGKYEQAVESLNKMMEIPCSDTVERLMLFLNVGKVYFKMQEVDSAAKYYKQMEPLLPSINVRKETLASAYGALSHLAESQNDASLALQYREKHEKLMYDVMLQRQENAIYRTQRQYDYESLKNEMNRKQSQLQLIIALGIVMLLCIMALFLYRSSQRNKKEAEANANLFHFMQQNKALVESNMAQEKKAIDATRQLSDMLFARFKAMQKLDYSMKNPKDKIALKDLEIEVFGGSEHWEAVKEVLDALYPGLWETIELKYPNMDEMERRVYMLSRCKLSRLEEAALLGISTSVLDKLRTKVRKKVVDNKL